MAVKRFPNLAHWGAFTAVVDDGRLIDCEPFPKDPVPSAMLASIAPMVYSPTRIQAPMVRRGWLNCRAMSDGSQRGSDSFVEVAWDFALDLIAEELARVRGEHGPGAIFGGSYGWASAGRFHDARSLVRRFMFSAGGCVDQVGNYSWGAAQFLLPHVIGTSAPLTDQVTSWRDIAANANLVLAFGGLAAKNSQVAFGGAAEHVNERWLRAAVQAGVKFVCVSPTRSDTPEYLPAEWVPIRPNTDVALMLALAHCLIADGRHDRTFLARYCVGFEQLEAYIMGQSDGVSKNPSWASAITSVDPQKIVELARRMAQGRTFLTASFSLQRARHGEQPYWMLIALAAMLGQIGTRGAGFGFGYGSANGVGNPRPKIPAPSMPVPRNPAGLAIPVARISDMLLEGGSEYEFNGRRDSYPKVKLVYWAGGNPFHHHQDLNRLQQAWSVPETVVVHDIWWTATARRADILLPATTMVERNDVGGSSRDRFVLAMHRAIDPVAGARDDHVIFRELSARLGIEEAFTESRSEMDWVQHIYERVRDAATATDVEMPPFETFWEQGYVELPAPSTDAVMFEEFRLDPDRNPLKTPSGRIELHSRAIADFGYNDCRGHPMWLPPGEWLGATSASAAELHLVTVQPADRLHSQMDPGPVSASNKVGGHERIRMNPADAEARGLVAGDEVRVWNARGACVAGLEIDDGVMPRVAVMATGAWYSPGLKDGSVIEMHGNPNVLTNDNATSRLTQGPNAMSVLVRVERWQGRIGDHDAWGLPAMIAQGGG